MQFPIILEAARRDSFADIVNKYGTVSGISNAHTWEHVRDVLAANPLEPLVFAGGHTGCKMFGAL